MKARIAILLFALPSLGSALPARAAGGSGGETQTQPASRLEVAMTLYAGGITMGHMDLDATQRGGEYHSVSTLQTSGVVNAFWQSESRRHRPASWAQRVSSPASMTVFMSENPAASRKCR